MTAYKRKDFEIMAPAGSYESLRAAIDAGADSVYFGAGRLNMRAASSANFSLDDISNIIDIAHRNGVKAYLTVNTVIYDEEIPLMRELIDRAAAEGIDAVIASDQTAIFYARSKGVEVHISTQLNISNVESLRFYSQWADVAVLARELTLEQIANINRTIIQENICGPSGEPVRIELFAHGALCMAVSGKCYISLHDNGCSANRGSCRQICRRSFTLTDTDTGQQLETDGNYLLSPKDLCTIGFLDKLVEAGVRVFKIEGRARSGEYVKRVVECYDHALRAIAEGRYTPELTEELTEKLAEVFNRGFWGGYYLGSPIAEITENYGSSATKRKVYVGKVTNYFKNLGVAEILIEASALEVGRDVIISGETTGILEMNAAEIRVEDIPAEIATQGVRCSIKTPSLIRRGDRLYKLVDADEI